MERLRPQWRELLENSIRPTLFAGWEWQYQCARLLVDSGHLNLLAVFNDDQLDGILPLYRSKTRLGGQIPADTLNCLGGSITDYNALVVRQRKLSQVIPAISHYLLKTGLILNFENVLPGTALYILARYLPAHGFREIIYESKTALYCDLGDDYTVFCQGLKRKFKKNLNNNRNHMNRDGQYSFHTEEPSEKLLGELIRLHTTRWEGKGEAGALARERIKSFHAALQQTEDRPFSIRYYTIRHDNRIIAIVYGFLFKDCFYAYLSGFDMAHNRISPGNMVLDYCVRNLIETGIGRMDMLRGDMQYKKSWATRTLAMKDRYLFPATTAGKTRHAALKALMALKRRLPVSLKKNLKGMQNNLTGNSD